MPVDYTIAARGAQGNTAPDFANMLAQYQMMGARAQQQQLEQLQYQKLQEEMQQQNALRGVLGGQNFNLMSPQGVQAIAPYDPSLAIQLSNALRSQQHYGALESQAQQELQAKLPVYGAQVQKEIAQGSKAALERDAELLRNHEVKGAKIVMADGKGYDEFHASLPKDLKAILPPKYDEQSLTNFVTQMATVQDNLKSHIQGIKEGETPVVVKPGITGAPTMQKVQEAPSIGRNLGPAGMELPPEAKAIQDTMATEQSIMRSAPAGREKEALGKYRFSNTLKDMGATFIDLAKAKGIVVPGESAGETFETLANRSKAGQILGKLDANERLALVDQLKSLVTTAVPQFAAAAGLQSKNFDSEKEGQRLMSALADPDNIANISSAFGILNNLNKQFGSGAQLFEPKKEIGGIIGARRPTAAPKTGGVVDFGDLK
jgi:hypothetical protein